MIISFYILIIANRKASRINEFFSQIQVPDDLHCTPLPLLLLDKNGIIVFNDGNSSAGPDEQPMDAPVPPVIAQAAVVAPMGLSLEGSSGIETVGVSLMAGEMDTSMENIFAKILTAEGPTEIQIFDMDRENLPDSYSTHRAVIEPRSTDNIQAMITEGRYTEARTAVQSGSGDFASFESCLLDSLVRLNEGKLDDALMHMETALSKKPDDRFLKYYRIMCEVAG